MDPFLPCSSYHFERNVRSVVLERRSTQGTDRSTSSAYSGNSTAQATGQSSSFTDTSAEQISNFPYLFFSLKIYHGILNGKKIKKPCTSRNIIFIFTIFIIDHDFIEFKSVYVVCVNCFYSKVHGLSR